MYRLILLSIMFTVYSSTAWSTIIIKRFSTDEMVHRSDTIGVGKVTDIRYEYTDKKQLFTYTTVSCDTLLKGDESVTTFDVIQLGGKTDKFSRAVYGAPSYYKGEEVVLFLMTHESIKTLKKVVAMSMGKYSVITDEQDGTKYAVTDLTDLSFATEIMQHERQGEDIVKKPLNDFIEEIKQAVIEENATSDQSLGSTYKIDDTDNKFDWIKWIQKKCVSTANNLSDKYYNYVVEKQG